MNPIDSKAPPPKQMIYLRQALFWHSLGFSIILVLTWCDSIFGLVHRLLGYPFFRPDELPETVLKLVVIVLLWLFSGMKLYKIVSRLNYLENFLHVCAWCRKIEYDNQWLTLEDHFLKQTGKKATHGICPKCSSKMRKNTQRVAKEMLQNSGTERDLAA